MLTYANVLDRVEQMLQDTSNATYDTTELGMWIEESLKEFSHYDPHLVPVLFQIESRTGTDTAGTASSLTDTTESQFLDTDDDNEKVIYNPDDHTWAVVEDYTSSSVLVLSADIMDLGENYRIYNKRCWNNKQIYIGDVAPYLWIDSVEYPIGQKRNWKVYDDILEIDVDFVADSDTTQTDLPNVDVLVRFALPHVLSQLTDWSGELTAATTAAATTIAIDGMGSTEIIEVGAEFHLEHHRSIYIVTTEVTTSGDSATIASFYPPLEAAASENDDITFTKSTLKPQHEELFCHLVAARAVLSDNITYINAIDKGGTDVWRRYQEWGERKLAEVLSKLDRISIPQTKRRYPTSL